MKSPSRNLDLPSWAGNARQLVAETCSLVNGPIRNLGSQVEELWRLAEELMPPGAPIDLMAHVERSLDDLRGWRTIGLRGQFST